MDTSRPPLGERQRKAILAEIVAGGDTAEKHYLEVKRELDFSSREETTKVAKFILGAANRLPTVALRNFGGYAVMVVGAEKGGLPGVPAGTEILDIEQKTDKFLQPGGPFWDLEREVADEAGREVLFIVVDPPKDGDPVHVCRSDYQSAKPKGTQVPKGTNLADGEIYVRVQGQTRKAKAAEVQALVARASSGSARAPELTVTLRGDAHFLRESGEQLDTFVETSIADAKAKYVQPPSAAQPALAGLASVQAALMSVGAGSGAPWTKERFERAASEWESGLRATWIEGIESIASAVLPGLIVEIGNLQSVFLEGVRLDLTLENAYGLTPLKPDDVDLAKIFPPVIKRANPYGIAPYIPPPINNRPFYSYPLKWNNTGKNLHVTVQLGDLRPSTPWVSAGDDLVVISRDEQAATVSGTWKATIRGHHEVYEGTVALPVSETQSLKSLLTRLQESR